MNEPGREGMSIIEGGAPPEGPTSVATPPTRTHRPNTPDSGEPDLTLSYLRAGADGTIDAPGPAEHARLGAAFAPGVVLQGRYVLERELGRGGMGQVYLGRDLRLDRPVAIKAILPGVGRRDEARVHASFVAEARIGAHLHHPAIATVFDHGIHEDRPFTIFEYLPGETLGGLLRRRGRLPLVDAQLILGPLAQALDFAHGRHVVHRDLKPENVRATEQGAFKLLDLGLAREFLHPADWTGFAGTPAYASPEQAAGLPCDGRADQYALALIVAELLTGRRVFEDRDWKVLLKRHQSQTPPSFRTALPDLPESVDLALLRALRKDPNHRFATCGEFATALGCRLLSEPSARTEFLLSCHLRSMLGRLNAGNSHLFMHLYAALEPEAIWSVHGSTLARWPLGAVKAMPRGDDPTVLNLDLAGRDGTVRQSFKFFSAAECNHWHDRVRTLAARVAPTDRRPIGDPVETEVVILARRWPGLRCQFLGPVEAGGEERRQVESDLLIRAAMLGGNAIVDVQWDSIPGRDRTVRRLTGTAIRAMDQAGCVELRARWRADQIAGVGRWLLIYLVASLGLKLLGSLSLFGLWLGRGGPGVGLRVRWLMVGMTLVYGWPMAMAALLHRLRWPQLARPLALAVAALVLLPVLSPFPVGYLRLVHGTGAQGWKSILGEFVLLPLLRQLDPVNLGIVGVGLFLARRAWRVPEEYHRDGPTAEAPGPSPRAVAARLALAGSLAYGLVLMAMLIWHGVRPS